MLFSKGEIPMEIFGAVIEITAQKPARRLCCAPPDSDLSWIPPRRSICLKH